MGHQTTDHEAVFRMAYERRWAELLDFVHRHRADIADDALLARAVAAFADAFFDALAADGPGGYRRELETLFLLHTGGFYRLSPARFADVAAHLAGLHADRPEAARGYARHAPDHPACAALLRGTDAPAPVAHAGDAAVALTRTAPAAGASHTVGLFKSQQEVDFFMAVREVFATYFVYPNVALSCLVDYEAVREALTPAERRYFFRALVDCVVFDQHDGYRPRYFFELDSVLHDTEERREKDRAKERILSLAGCTLHRLRNRRRGGRKAYAALLKEVAASVS